MRALLTLLLVAGLAASLWLSSPLSGLPVVVEVGGGFLCSLVVISCGMGLWLTRERGEA